MATNITAYSKALFELAQEENKTETFVEYAKEILELINEEKLVEYLSDPYIEIQDKEKMLEEAFGKEGNFFAKWILLIVEAKAVRKLTLALNKFISMVNESNGVVEGVAYTTTKLDAASIKKIEEAISKAQDKKVSLNNKIDNQLLGGVRVEVEDQVYDNSIKRKLKELTFELLKGEK